MHTQHTVLCKYISVCHASHYCAANAISMELFARAALEMTFSQNSRNFLDQISNFRLSLGLSQAISMDRIGPVPLSSWMDIIFFRLNFANFFHNVKWPICALFTTFCFFSLRVADIQSNKIKKLANLN